MYFFFILLLYGATALDYPEPTRDFLALNKEHFIRVSPYSDVAFYVIKLPKANQPLFMYITPCSSSVHWQLRIPNQFIMSPYLPSHSQHFDHILHMRIPPLIEYHSDMQLHDHLILLAGEENDKRMHFYANAIEADYVVLNMTAERFTAVQLFVSTDQDTMDRFYPNLEKNNKFEVKVEDAGHIKEAVEDSYLTWTPPDYAVKSPDAFKYCLLVNDHQNEYAMCEHFNVDIDYIHCVHGNASDMTLKTLEPNKKHYLTLFLINQRTKGKTAYMTQEITIKGKVKKETPLLGQEALDMTLFDSALSSHTLPLPKGSYVNHTYIPNKSSDSNEIVLLINSCNGYIYTEVLRNDSLIYKSASFIGFKRFVIKTNNTDVLKINVINDDNVQIRYWIWVSYNEDNSPFPSLPFDRSIRLVERQCISVKLEWLRANDDENTRYCVHIKESRNDYLTDIINEPSQMCWSQMPAGRKVLCVTPKDADLSDLHTPGFLDLQTTVDSLKSATIYRFDLSVLKIGQPDAQPLPYRPIFVRTLKDC
ncbi:unnamed protein product [Bursaphelenchus okinawaensis]|uniref:Protein NDNF n=1 Tax=Bursaphelenchus okinawaensis TaxID=465554 RepID=A0A811KVB7_9BILA|nr:unnamed protein product [Bursaphelenchus okinawaensis]CAG9113913.1 unnamed protein product [Bursaphelenchus okinawaensis]